MKVIVVVCQDADEAHGESLRAYAHAFCSRRDTNTVCVASSFFVLSPKHRWGILAHEIGHLLAGPDADEAAADLAFWEETGIQIGYADGPHGRCLQALDDEDASSLIGVFKFDFQGQVNPAASAASVDEVEYIVFVDGEEDSRWPAMLQAEARFNRLSRSKHDVEATAFEEGRQLGWRITQ